jgi:MoxR domain in the MoxR-vWA-beta-propeller ternary systems
MKSIEAFDVTPSQLIPLIRTALEGGKVPIVLGPPGLGKSTMINFLGKEVNREVHDIRAAYLTPTDLMGMPYLDRDTNSMQFAPMGLLPSKPGSLVFWDEGMLAPRAVMNCMLQGVLDNRIGAYEFPEDTWQVMAGNRMEDRCFSEKLSPALVNRLIVFRLKPDLNDWCEWAYGAGIDMRIVAYVRFNPDSLLDFNPSEWNGESNFSSPRSWEALHKLMATDSFKKLSRDMKRVVTVGTVGQAVGTEFSGYLEVYDSLPSLEQVLLEPSKAPVPTEASAKIAAAAMVASHATKDNFSVLLTYAARFEKMFEVFAIKASIARDASLMSTPEIIKWITANKDVFRNA